MQVQCPGHRASKSWQLKSRIFVDADPGFFRYFVDRELRKASPLYAILEKLVVLTPQKRF
jgi:hypothetical protein